MLPWSATAFALACMSRRSEHILARHALALAITGFSTPTRRRGPFGRFEETGGAYAVCCDGICGHRRARRSRGTRGKIFSGGFCGRVISPDKIGQLLATERFPDLVLSRSDHNNVDWAWRCPPSETGAAGESIAATKPPLSRKFSRDRCGG